MLTISTLHDQNQLLKFDQNLVPVNKSLDTYYSPVSCTGSITCSSVRTPPPPSSPMIGNNWEIPTLLKPSPNHHIGICRHLGLGPTTHHVLSDQGTLTPMLTGQLDGNLTLDSNDLEDTAVASPPLHSTPQQSQPDNLSESSIVIPPLLSTFSDSSSLSLKSYPDLDNFLPFATSNVLTVPLPPKGFLPLIKIAPL